MDAELKPLKDALQEIIRDADAVAAGAMRFGSAGGSLVAGWAKGIAEEGLKVK